MKLPIIVVRRSTLEAAREGEPPKPFLPFVLVKRSRFHKLELDLWRRGLQVHDQQVALSKLGRRRVEEKREYAEMLDGMRLVRATIEGNPHRGETVTFVVRMPEYLFDNYRHNTTFRELLVYHIEHVMRSQPEGRSILAGFPDSL